MPQTMVYTGATIWTGVPDRPRAEALWIREGVVGGVGSEQEVLAAAGPGAWRVDLDGAFVFPGLVDAHAHVLSFGLSRERLDLVGAASLEETLDRVEAWAARHREEGRSGWIRGRGWDQNDWPVQAFPTRQDLDRVCPGIPVCLNRVDGHAIWVNTKALELAGVDASTPDPEGGKIHRDPGGMPTGVFVDAAAEQILAEIPEVDRATKLRVIRDGTRELARAGLTGIHDMGMTADEAAIYRELAARGELSVRIYGALGADAAQEPGALRGGPDPDWGDGWFRLGMVKFYADGALGSRGAALLEDYADDPGNTGLMVTAPDSLRELMRDALAHGFQCAVHAIGDRGNRAVLDAWAALAPEFAASEAWSVPARRPPVRLEHAQVLHLDDIPRVGELGVLAGMQPTHCTSDMPWAPERLGPERIAGAYAWRAVLDGGAVLAAGSDFPIESHDPRYGLYAAVTRRQPDGFPPEGWTPGQRLSPEEALVAFTAAPAHASGDLHRLGTLAPGVQADFSVFDRDLAADDPGGILDARALLTVVGGRETWRDPAVAKPTAPAPAEEE